MSKKSARTQDANLSKADRRLAATGTDGPSDGYFTRPLAPAPIPVVIASVVVTSVVLVLITQAISSDAFAALLAVVVLTAGWALLDFSGRRRATTEPHQLYGALRLPTESSWFKRGLVILTLIVLIVVVGITADPNQKASPLPYFLAVVFLALVMPQIVARRLVRRHDRKERIVKK